VIATEHAEQAVIVEGMASQTKDAAFRKRFNALYEKKYEWDMSDFDEPVYKVEPRRAFGLYERDFQGSATRWQF
jgi:hypothetical protein